MESVTLKGCKVHYDPKNISKEAAINQAKKRIEEVRKTGGRLKSFTAFTPHKGEDWYEQLRKVRKDLSHEKIHR